jgi:hypothetical protein
VRASQFFSLIDKGLLPNCKALMENGIYSKNCVTDFPAITYPTQVSILTGTYTGDYRHEQCHGIPLSNWIGRDYNPPILRNYGSTKLEIYKMNDDLGKNCQTICEMIPEGNKTSITQFINRGVDYFFPNRKIKLIFYYLLINYYKNIKRIIKYANNVVVNKLLENFRHPTKFFDINEAPICSLIWFLTSDVLMHRFGNSDPLYKLNLLHIDRVIGKLVTGLRELGYLEDTAIAITADHGNYRANKVGNLDNIQKALGLSNYHHRKNINGSMNIAEFGGLGFFYFKPKILDGKERWNYPSIEQLKRFGPKKINLFDKMFKIEGTKIMYYKDKNNTHQKGQIFLKRKVGKEDYILGRIEYRGTGKQMQTRHFFENNNEKDVFGYYKDNIASTYLDGKFHSIEEWLEATNHLDFPLYPDLLCRHFKNPRSADIILSTEGEIIYNIQHGIKKSDNLYSHDIGKRNSSIVPLIISGSNEIPKREIPFCKITDIVPTLLRLLGLNSAEGVIGRSLI